jgi:hypothetical protein
VADPADLGESNSIDLLEVPGFTGMRHRRDLELAEVHAGRRRGQEVSTLPVNCRWVAITRGTKDEPSHVKLMRAANQGYLPVKADQVGKETWLTAMPPGARKLPDGSIVNAAGDLQLHYAPQRIAARNQARKDRANREQMDGVGNLGNAAEGFESVARSVKGIADVHVTRSTG